MAESILHIGGITLRLNGSGNMDIAIKSLDDIKSKTLRSIVMSSSTNVEPIRLTNFKSQRYAIEFSVDVIDEYFSINRVVIWLNQIYTSYPSVMNG